ncbi:MAG: hypothetical protein DMF63_07275 [Acidobacteria bacterium]|nr:MAG: hypothetical protein DMF63_07275 [Acidobacteriota bacterium]
MTNRKNNSILFLTTLGVYLGLMLVGGAAPQVFAHGALTRHFELQDEIEISDDLDKKPDTDTFDCTYDPVLTVPENIAHAYAEAILGVIRDPFFADLSAQGHLYDERAEYLLQDGNESSFGAVCRDFRSRLTVIALDNDEFSVIQQIGSKTPIDPLALMTFLQAGFESKRLWSSDDGIVIRHTHQSVINDQLYVVTRLPRAGLDPLLASRAK